MGVPQNHTVDIIQEKPLSGFIQKLVGLQAKKIPHTLYLSPSSIYFPRLDPHGNIAILDESVWDKHCLPTTSIKDYPKLQVVQKDGDWFALNSAQLQLFQKWEREGKCSKVKVDIVSLHHVPPMLRNLMTTSDDRKHCSHDLLDKSINGNHIIDDDHKFLEPGFTDEARICGGMLSQTRNINGGPSCHTLTGSHSAPNGIAIKDSEQNETIHYESHCSGGGGNSGIAGRGGSVQKGEMLYKTLSSFQLDKQCDKKECGGVQTARGYHKVGQHPNDDDSDSGTSDDDEDDDDQSTDENGEDDEDEISSQDEDSGESDCDSVYSIGIIGSGSELDWTDDGDEASDDDLDDDADDDDEGEDSDELGSDEDTEDNNQSDTQSPHEKVNENESLL